MVTQHYRWDFIGLSSYDKPTPETSEKVVDGSTYYEADTSKLYVYYKDTWYEKTATGGGGGGDITVVQTTGDSTTDVMSQNATTSMIYSDPLTRTKVQLGQSSNTAGDYGSVLGSNGQAEGISSVALANSRANFKGQFDVSTVKAPGMGYDGTNLRRITGVYPPVAGTDAATKGYVDTYIENSIIIKPITNFEYNFDSTDPTNPDPLPENCNSWALWKFPSYGATFLSYENGLGSDIYIQGGSSPQTINDLAGPDASITGIIVVGEVNGVVNTAIYSVFGQIGPFPIDPSTGEPV